VTRIYGIRYADGSWLRNDGYATRPGVVSKAWTGTRESAQRMIDLGVPLEKATIAPIPITKEG
jgi:hypothetical protein